jgi:hypothetical protein
MAAIRTLFRKYWILIVIVLWVIAWANRDRLAGAEEVATATVAESVVPVAETPSPPVPGSAPDPSPAAAGAVSHGAAAAAAPTSSETDAVPEISAAPEAPVAAAIPRPVQPEVSAAEGRGATQSTPAAELLAQSRVALRSHGARGAAEVLARGLRDIPADAAERADLLGELGNFYISAGDFQRALAAYDQALLALPADARGTMITRLASVYDRFHPMGRSHLEQFR